MGQSCPRLRLRVSTQWFFSISSGALCGQARGIRESSDGLERSIACTPEPRRACGRRQVVACALRKQRCSGAEAAGAVQMQGQMACNATANAGVRARAAAPSTAGDFARTAVSFSSGLFFVAFLLPIIFLDRLVRAGISKFQSRCTVCHETRDTMSISRIRRRVRAETVSVLEGVEQAAGAGPAGCRVRAFFATRCGTGCVWPRREGWRRKSHRVTSTRRSTAHPHLPPLWQHYDCCEWVAGCRSIWNWWYFFFFFLKTSI